MRHRFLKVATLAAILALPVISRADTFVLSDSGQTLTFSLPSSPSGVISSGSYFEVPNVPVTSGLITTSADVYFNNSGDIALQFPATGQFPYGIHDMGISFSGVMYTGSASKPTFVAGDYNVTFYPSLSDYYSNTDGTPGTVDITATPEPSSLVLLGTGLVGLAGAARRKFSK